MCGICGIVSRNPLKDFDPVRQMQDALQHRGPDGAGDFSDDHIFMAMRRLSIIDLKTGWQPLYNEDRSLVLIANGEIYNFVELGEHLRKRGHRFASQSDCETILHLYEDHQEECVLHLRGMFAFALWDTRRQRLLLARDRMGEKPLYLYENQGQLVFASELKALLQSGLVPFELDPVAVDRYFHYQYVPEPETPVKGVRKLSAAHTLSVNAKSWTISERCYWRMEDAEPLEGDPAELIRAELDRVTELVIRSDVPVGVALSGGLDSSAVAALATRKYPGTIHAFSVGYPDEWEGDERPQAKALADFLGIPFHEIQLTTADMVSLFPNLVYWRDDPIADMSGYGYYAVMKLAHDHGVPVIMQGQGGDELFWGYSWVRKAVRESSWKMEALRKGPPTLLNSLHLETPEGFPCRGRKEFVRTIGGVRRSLRRYQRWKTTPRDRVVFYDLESDFENVESKVRSVYAPAYRDQLKDVSAGGLFDIPQPWPQLEILMTRLICQTYLIENGITQGDRLGMASSVELRLPLVDFRLVETVIGLRKTCSDYRLPPKAWLKESLRGLLPDWVMRRPKRGFTPPVRVWQEALFAAYGAQLANGYLVQTGVLTPQSAAAISIGNSTRDTGIPLSFKALVLEMWCRRLAAV